MKPNFLVLFLCCAAIPAAAEQATYDLIRYEPPPAWKGTAWVKDDSKKDFVTYTSTDEDSHSYCQIFIFHSIASRGDIGTDFDSEWKALVVENYKVTEPPRVTDALAEQGWKVKAGVASFAFDKGTSIAILTTATGFGRTTSVVAVTSNNDYVPAIQRLLTSIGLNKPAVSGAAPGAAARPAAPQTAKPAALQGYMDYNPFTKSWTWKVRYPPK